MDKKIIEYAVNTYKNFQNDGNQSKKWVRLSNILKEKFSVDISSKQIRDKVQYRLKKIDGIISLPTSINIYKEDTPSSNSSSRNFKEPLSKLKPKKKKISKNKETQILEMNNEELISFFQNKFGTSRNDFLVLNDVSGEVLPYIKEKDLETLPVTERIHMEWLVDKAKVKIQSFFSFLILVLTATEGDLFKELLL